MISIITVNYNHLVGLKCTMESVLVQTYRDVEYIIIDGGSTDGSKEYIEENSSWVDFWMSEPDRGVYDAMNKGIAKASGEYVLFMNSGDCFASKHVLEKVFENKRYDADLIVGRQYHKHGDCRRASRRIFQNEIDERFLISNTLPHQATFIKKELLLKTEGYDLKYKIVADWVFWNEAIVRHHASVDCVDIFVAEMEEEGLSGNINSCREEMARYLMDNRDSMSINDWMLCIQENNESYKYRRARRSLLGSILMRLALRLNKS